MPHYQYDEIDNRTFNWLKSKRILNGVIYLLIQRRIQDCVERN